MSKPPVDLESPYLIASVPFEKSFPADSLTDYVRQRRTTVVDYLLFLYFANLCREFDIPLDSHHRALCDARATAGILAKINRKRADSVSQ